MPSVYLEFRFAWANLFMPVKRLTLPETYEHVKDPLGLSSSSLYPN